MKSVLLAVQPPAVLTQIGPVVAPSGTTAVSDVPESPENSRGCAEAVEARLGDERVGGLRGGLAELREAIEAQLNSA